MPITLNCLESLFVWDCFDIYACRCINAYFVDCFIISNYIVIEDVGADDVIPLPNVTSKVLSKVIEYCKEHVEAANSDDRATYVNDELKAWDADFVKVDRATLRELKRAADYLEIKSLLDLMSQTLEDITLMSCDHKTFEVDKSVALMSQTIKHLIEDVCVDYGIPLPNVESKILCKVDNATLFDLILSANYLNIKSLLDLTCETVADMVKGKTPEEIRKKFNIKDDFTPEGKEEVRREKQWAFE
ncbi:hypothetical protein SLEP1_g28275 [Rubroshorea leprosula]|uniref:SKP1-like protein n=1 Tax=Rubroshorea leprosula TaxID=152421 RepID=A0AAV5K5I3_9ROSI|nr:hypothetical protein SLEP1_g28275 [Rubroshorea leprosula]